MGQNVCNGGENNAETPRTHLLKWSRYHTQITWKSSKMQMQNGPSQQKRVSELETETKYEENTKL